MTPMNFTMIEKQIYATNLQSLGNKTPASLEHLRISRAPCKIYCKEKKKREKRFFKTELCQGILGHFGKINLKLKETWI